MKEWLLNMKTHGFFLCGEACIVELVLVVTLGLDMVALGRIGRFGHCAGEEKQEQVRDATREKWWWSITGPIRDSPRD
jgi:hypothetical protein